MIVETTINITAIIEACDISGREQDDAYQDLLDEIEPPFFLELLKFTKGNKTRAAIIAGIDRSTLERRLKQHGIIFKKQMTRKAVQS